MKAALSWLWEMLLGFLVILFIGVSATFYVLLAILINTLPLIIVVVVSVWIVIKMLL